MKKYLFILFCFPFYCFGQNLVPNPSFEIYDTCPNTQGQINYAIPWYGNTVDYYNTCAISVCPYCGLPLAAGGFQYARTGNAIAGFYSYYYNLTTSEREYLQTKLLDTLVNNKCYLVTFYANLYNGSIWGIKNLAANFSDTTFTNPTFAVHSLQADIYKFDKPLISDTLNWVEIKGIYKAVGGEKYFTIGNFDDDANVDTVQTNPSGWSAGSYYFIDDVSVIQIDSIVGGMSANAGNDTSVVSGDSVFIGQQITGLNCTWYNAGGFEIAANTSGIYVHPTSTTFYTVQQNLCGTITYDTVNVTVLPVGISEKDLSKEVKIYPNPSNGEFTIELPKENASWKITISDTQGRIIYKETTEKKIEHLKLDVENGVYMIFISNPKTNESIVKRIVIQK
jgi:hypothetical protein